tara:strand:- start:870 stop:1220 length:351 start_codon:yes stop_codon:yes gene_type:complete
MTKEPTPKAAHNTDSYTLESSERGDATGRETAYRRGYFQGYHAAMLDADALEAKLTGHGTPTPLSLPMEEFLYDGLYEWRYSKHGGQLSMPPLGPSKGGGVASVSSFNQSRQEEVE